MRNHHISERKKGFFEGWYLKHQTKSSSIAFIPGINVTPEGAKSAFIQIITNEGSFRADYSFKDFCARKNEFYVKIGNNVFTGQGLDIDIQKDGIVCKGRVEYGPFTPIKYDIMGPFAVIPGMECNHGVLSMGHPLKGSVSLNGKDICLDGGIGYIEKDWGKSFPSKYTWLHCNIFEDSHREDCSLMISTAHIPFGVLDFKGLIAVVHYKGKEYRIATYNGGRVVHSDKNSIIIRRGKYMLQGVIEDCAGNPLKAPVSGRMEKTIHESPSCSGKIIFSHNGKKIFEKKSNHISFEFSR